MAESQILIDVWFLEYSFLLVSVIFKKKVLLIHHGGQKQHGGRPSVRSAATCYTEEEVLKRHLYFSFFKENGM